MSILSWILVGLVAGWLASMVMTGGGYGTIGDIIVGIVGAIVGGYLATNMFGNPEAVNGFNLSSILVAFLGAVVTIAILRALTPGRHV